jgi:hypothetical protein
MRPTLDNVPVEINLEIFKFLQKIEIDKFRFISKKFDSIVEKNSTFLPNIVFDKIIAENINGERALKIEHRGQTYILLQKSSEHLDDWQIVNHKLLNSLSSCYFSKMTTYNDSFFWNILEV